MIEDGVTKMSVRFGDPDPSVYEDLEPQTEDQEPQKEDVSGSETGVSTAGYGKSNAAATGEVTLDTLKNGWETIRSDENKYDLHYEDVRDLLGCDGLRGQAGKRRKREVQGRSRRETDRRAGKGP